MVFILLVRGPTLAEADGCQRWRNEERTEVELGAVPARRRLSVPLLLCGICAVCPSPVSASCPLTGETWEQLLCARCAWLPPSVGQCPAFFL